ANAGPANMMRAWPDGASAARLGVTPPRGSICDGHDRGQWPGIGHKRGRHDQQTRYGRHYKRCYEAVLRAVVPEALRGGATSGSTRGATSRRSRWAHYSINPAVVNIPNCHTTHLTRGGIVAAQLSLPNLRGQGQFGQFHRPGHTPSWRVPHPPDSRRA